MASRDEDYKFLRISDAAASINQKVNLIGIVMETSIPKQSKGTGSRCCCPFSLNEFFFFFKHLDHDNAEFYTVSSNLYDRLSLDFFCTVRLVDESMPHWGVSVTFFSETMEKLPQVQCAGDIIQLSRVVVIPIL